MSLKKKITIAVDGYSSCGKSTLAKGIAKALSILYVDSGAMYRAVTLFALKNSGIISGKKIDENRLLEHLNDIDIRFEYNQGKGKYETFMNRVNVESEIRSIEVSNMVSYISEIGFVRERLVELQREYTKKQSLVMDGRDIGTVVFPDADIKFFMTADKDVRAKRRYDELLQKNVDAGFEEIKRNIEERDRIDSSRKIAPLQKAKDAIVLDNSHMTPDGQLKWALQKINETFASKE